MKTIIFTSVPAKSGRRSPEACARSTSLVTTGCIRLRA